MDFYSEEQRRQLDKAKTTDYTYFNGMTQDKFSFDNVVKRRLFEENFMESKATHRVKTQKDFEDIKLTEKEQKKLDKAWKKNKQKYSDSFKKKRLDMYQDYLANKETELGNITTDRLEMEREKENWKNSEAAQKQKELNDTLVATMTDHIGRLTYLKGTAGDNEAAKAALDKAVMTVENILIVAGEKFDTSNEADLEQSTSTLERLYGQMNINLNEAMTALGNEHVAIKDLSDLCAIYDGVNCRLFDEVRNVIDSKETISSWIVIIQRAQGQKLTVLEQETKHTHGANSDVHVIEDGKTKRFFKADGSISEYEDVQKEAVSAVVEEGEVDTYLKLLQDFETGLKAENKEASTVNAYKQFIADFQKRYNPELSANIEKEIQEWRSKEWSPSQKIMIEILEDKKRKAIESREALEKKITDILGEQVDISKFAAILMKAFAIENTINLGKEGGIQSGANLMKRNIATERMSKLLGMGSVVVHSSLESIEQSGKTIHGFAMENSGGVDFNTLKKIMMSDRDITLAEMSKEASEQLTRLQFLDNITGQIDRHRNNIHYIYRIEEEKAEGSRTNHSFIRKRIVITGVRAIDNDMAFGDKFDVTRMNKNTMGFITPVKEKRNVNGVKKDVNVVSIPYVSEAFKEKLKGISADDIRKTLAGLVEKEYIESCVKRFVALKRIVLGKTYDMDNAESDMVNSYYDELNRHRSENEKIFFSSKANKVVESGTYEGRIIEGGDGLRSVTAVNGRIKLNSGIKLGDTSVEINGKKLKLSFNKYSDIRGFDPKTVEKAAEAAEKVMKNKKAEEITEQSFMEEIASQIYWKKYRAGEI